MANPVMLNGVAGTLLPPTITGPIFAKAQESSAVMSLARRVPLSVSAATAIPVPMDVPMAGWVNEAGVKPVAAGGVGVKMMTGKKVALLVPVSQEVAMSNPAGLYSQLQQDLPTAIARAFDYAAIHGLDFRTGSTGPFTDYLTQTSNVVELGTATQAAGGMYADLVTGMSKVVNQPQGWEFTGFAADPRIKPLLMLQTDLNGRPLMVDAYPNANNGAQFNSLIGFPAAYNSGVSGNLVRDGSKVQTIVYTGTVTGGTFRLNLNGAFTSAIAYNAATGAVQTAVQAILPAGDTVAVTGTAGSTYTLTFDVGPGPVSLSSALTGTGGPGATIAYGTGGSHARTLRAIGGDWSQCAYGVGMDISIKVSDTASYIDGAGVTHSAFQENLVLLLVEAYYGFVVNNPQAFNAYIDAV